MLDSLITPNGQTIVTRFGSGETLQIWDIKSERRLTTISTPAPQTFFTEFKMTVSSDGQTLAAIDITSERDYIIRLIDLKTEKQFKTLKPTTGVPTAISFSPNGKQLVLGYHSGVTQVWDIQ